MTRVLLLVLGAACVGCARPGGGTDDQVAAARSEGAESCAPVSQGVMPSAASLVGEYALVMVASAGEAEGRKAEGPLALRSTTRSDAALVGTTGIPVETVGAHRLGSLDATGDSAPGVAAFLGSGDPPSVLLRLGSEANALGVVRFDGAYTVLDVRAGTADGFAGTWRSGVTEDEASGHFCATRTESN